MCVLFDTFQVKERKHDEAGLLIRHEAGDWEHFSRFPKDTIPQLRQKFASAEKISEHGREWETIYDKYYKMSSVHLGKKTRDGVVSQDANETLLFQ